MFALADTQKAGNMKKECKESFAMDFGLRVDLARQVACISSAQES
jgi:hypothetical protein